MFINYLKYKMAFNIEAIIYYIFLLDSIVDNLVIWFFPNLNKWYKKKWFSKYFPATKGWGLWYLILIIWVGYSLYRLGILPY